MRKEKAFGYYQILDLYQCKSSVVGDIKVCYNYLDKLAEFLKLKKVSPPFIIYTDEKKYPDKAGLSGWIPLQDETTNRYCGVSIHTLTVTRFVSIDIYTTRKFDRKKIKEFTFKIFKPKNFESKYLLRK